MKKFIRPKGNLRIGLRASPFWLCGKHSEIEIRIFFKNFGWFPAQQWTRLTMNAMSEEELIPEINQLIMELCRVREKAIKIFRGAEAGKITEEYFKNQKVNSE